jgi:hypothetical protein
MKPSVTRTTRSKPQRRPWLPAIGFYLTILILAAASFVFVLGLSTGLYNDSDWLTAGLIAVIVIIAGILLREVVLRSVRERRVAERNRLDRNLRHSAAIKAKDSSKFTLEKNAAALEIIMKKSDAANLFGRISAGHREVFELCDEYRDVVAKELPTVHPNSPRLRALSKGSDVAEELHRHHMLRWAELETRALTNEAQGAETVAGKAAYAQRAKTTIEFALSRYPDDLALRETADVLDEILVSLKSTETNDKVKPNGDGAAGIEAVEHNEVPTKKKNSGGKKKRKN